MAEKQPAPQSSIDRRLHPRLDVMEHASLLLGSNPAVRTCVIVDVSLGGLQARGRDAFAVGDRILVSVGPGEDQRLSIYAEVKYSVPVGETGMFATGMRVSSEDRRALRAWVDFVRSVFASQPDWVED